MLKSRTASKLWHPSYYSTSTFESVVFHLLYVMYSLQYDQATCPCCKCSLSLCHHIIRESSLLSYVFWKLCWFPLFISVPAFTGWSSSCSLVFKDYSCELVTRGTQLLSTAIILIQEKPLQSCFPRVPVVYWGCWIWTNCIMVLSVSKEKWIRHWSKACPGCSRLSASAEQMLVEHQPPDHFIFIS